MKILLIDLSAIYWAAWHSSANEAVSQAQSRTLAGVAKAISIAGADHVAICCDTGRSWRKEIAESYKAHRPEKDHAALDELRRVEERLEADGHLLWKFVAFEADDVIATAEKLALAEKVTIATADKDLLQLVGVGTEVLSTRTWETIGPDQVFDKFKVRPDQIADYLALVGDASDGIKGAPGIGPVKAAQLLEQHGSLKAIFNAVHTAPDSFPAAILKTLKEHGETVDLARRLVTLRTDVPLHFPQIFEKREQRKLLMEDPVDEPKEEPTAYEKAAEEIRAVIDEAKAHAGLRREVALQMAVDDGKIALPETAAGRIENLRREEEKKDAGFSVHRYDVTFDRQLEPVSLASAYRLARGMYESRLYQKFPNPEAIFAVIIRGRELGIPAMTALDCFHVVEGRPTPSAHLIIELAQRHDECEYFECTHTDDKSAEWSVKKKGRPVQSLTYTIEQARQAGLLEVRQGKQPGNWHKRPAEMLRKTAGVQLARMVFPGSSLGLYAVEETGE